jgi:cytochrome c2
MRRKIFANILLLMFIAALSACTGDDDYLGDPESFTRRQCGHCHRFESAFRKTGPSLQGLFGRIPKISGVPYAVWDEKSLDEWIENPTRIKPTTTMAMPGIKSAEKRAVIIEYLKQL